MRTPNFKEAQIIAETIRAIEKRGSKEAHPLLAAKPQEIVRIYEAAVRITERFEGLGVMKVKHIQEREEMLGLLNEVIRLYPREAISGRIRILLKKYGLGEQ